MNTYLPSEHEINENRTKVIYDAVSKLEKNILAEMGLNPEINYIGGMHLSASSKDVELDIYGMDDKYVTDSYVRVLDVMGAENET